MTYLLDTNVVNELRKPAGRIDASVAAWGSALDSSEQFLRAITVFEVDLGILLVERRDAAQGARLDLGVRAAFDERILAVDRDVARRAVELRVPDPRPECDAYVGATALVHGLTVATRNVRDFEPMGVPVTNPWA